MASSVQKGLQNNATQFQHPHNTWITTALTTNTTNSTVKPGLTPPETSVSTFAVIIIVICIPCFIAAVIGNLFVIIVRLKALKRVGLSAYKLLICHLSIADIIYSTAIAIDIHDKLNSKRWIQHRTTCKLLLTTQSASLTASIVIMTAMAFERFQGVSDPLRHHWSTKKLRVIPSNVMKRAFVGEIRKFPMNCAVFEVDCGGGIAKIPLRVGLLKQNEIWPSDVVILTIVIWVYSYINFIPYGIALDVVDGVCFDEHYPSPQFAKWYTLYQFISSWLAPLLLIITFHFGMIIKVLAQRKSIRKSTYRPTGRSTNEASRAKERNHKMIKILVVIVTLFATLTLPIHIWYLWYEYSDRSITESYDSKVLEIFATFVYLHSAVNPIIYSLMDTRFREDVKALFGCVESRAKRDGIPMRTLNGETGDTNAF
eukprot:gene14022-15481_t